MSLLNLLKLPESRTLADLDDPASTAVHGRVIRRKDFLRRLYREWYETLRDAIPVSPGRVVVELGSGGGFIREIVPDAITSDVLPLPGVDRHFSALEMPFADGTLDAVVMIDVLHHIPDLERFFRELDRCLKPGGKAVMIEPANTVWGRFVYRNFHHEPFDTTADWRLPDGGPMSSANGALPWIVLARDRRRFEREFPSLAVRRFEPHTPLRYLLSGGVSFRQLVPSWSFGLIRTAERALGPLNRLFGMFYTVEIVKRDPAENRLTRAA